MQIKQKRFLWQILAPKKVNIPQELKLELNSISTAPTMNRKRLGKTKRKILAKKSRLMYP